MVEKTFWVAIKLIKIVVLCVLAHLGDKWGMFGVCLWGLAGIVWGLIGWLDVCLGVIGWDDECLCSISPSLYLSSIYVNNAKNRQCGYFNAKNNHLWKPHFLFFDKNFVHGTSCTVRGCCFFFIWLVPEPEALSIKQLASSIIGILNLLFDSLTLLFKLRSIRGLKRPFCYLLEKLKKTLLIVPYRNWNL